MSQQSINLKFTGLRPLIMHNGMLVDRAYWANKALKPLTSKRSKTDADHDLIDKLSFLGALYVNKDQKPILPWFVLRASLVNAAKGFKMGTQAKTGLFVTDDAIVDYGADLTPEGLWDDEKYRNRAVVSVGTASIVRVRPQFPTWSVNVPVEYSEDVLSREDVIRIADRAGRFVGVGDWRPQTGGMFGTFKVECE